MQVPQPYSQWQFEFDQEPALCRASASRACDEDPGLVRSRRRQCSPGVRNSQWRGWDRWTPFVRWRPASRSCIRPRFERGAPCQAAENQKAKCKTSSASARAAYTWPKETNHGVARGLSPGVDSGKCRTDSTGSIACLETATVGKEIFRSILGAGSATENPQPAYPIGLSNSVAAEYRGYQSHWHPPMNCCAYGPRTVAIILEPALRDFRVGGGKLGPAQLGAHNHLAQAVLAQAKAFTALVSQIASQSSDPMPGLGATTFGVGTRGAQGRANLQAELAQHRGSFFDAFLTAMARRMQLTAPSDGSPVEDPLSSIFSHRQTLTLSKARAFSPPVAPQLVTVALVYVKELDLISAKRLEMTVAPNPILLPLCKIKRMPQKPKLLQTKRKRDPPKGAPAAAADAEE